MPHTVVEPQIEISLNEKTHRILTSYTQAYLAHIPDDASLPLEERNQVGSLAKIRRLYGLFNGVKADGKQCTLARETYELYDHAFSIREQYINSFVLLLKKAGFKACHISSEDIVSYPLILTWLLSRRLVTHLLSLRFSPGRANQDVFDVFNAFLSNVNNLDIHGKKKYFLFGSKVKSPVNIDLYGHHKDWCSVLQQVISSLEVLDANIRAVSEAQTFLVNAQRKIDRLITITLNPGVDSHELSAYCLATSLNEVQKKCGLLLPAPIYSEDSSALVDGDFSHINLLIQRLQADLSSIKHSNYLLALYQLKRQTLFLRRFFSSVSSSFKATGWLLVIGGMIDFSAVAELLSHYHEYYRLQTKDLPEHVAESNGVAVFFQEIYQSPKLRNISTKLNQLNSHEMRSKLLWIARSAIIGLGEVSRDLSSYFVDFQKPIFINAGSTLTAATPPAARIMYEDASGSQLGVSENPPAQAFRSPVEEDQAQEDAVVKFTLPARYQEAVDFFDAGEYDKAIKIFSEITQSSLEDYMPAAYLRVFELSELGFYHGSKKLPMFGSKNTGFAGFVKPDSFRKVIAKVVERYLGWFQKQAETQHPEALVNLADCYYYFLRRTDVEKTRCIAQSQALYQRACQKKDKRGALRLSACVFPSYLSLVEGKKVEFCKIQDFLGTDDIVQKHDLGQSHKMHQFFDRASNVQSFTSFGLTQADVITKFLKNLHHREFSDLLFSQMIQIADIGEIAIARVHGKDIQSALKNLCSETRPGGAKRSSRKPHVEKTLRSKKNLGIFVRACLGGQAWHKAMDLINPRQPHLLNILVRLFPFDVYIWEEEEARHLKLLIHCSRRNEVSRTYHLLCEQKPDGIYSYRLLHCVPCVSPLLYTRLGDCYKDGLGVFPDHALAFRYYACAASAEDSIALSHLACCYETGIGVGIDTEAAKILYYKAFSLGHQDSYACYLRLKSQERAPQGGLNLLTNEMASLKNYAYQGSFESALYLANIFQKKDDAKDYLFLCRERKPLDQYVSLRIRLLEQKGKDNAKLISEAYLNAEKCFWQGQTSSKQSEAIKIIEYLASDMIFLPAKLHLALVDSYKYDSYLKEIKKDAESFPMKIKNIHLPEVSILFCLAQYYRNIDRNHEVAFSIYSQIKDDAFYEGLAAFFLGECYQYGLGVNPDSEEAFTCYEKAKNTGLKPAFNAIGVCYQEGIGVSIDTEKALGCFDTGVYIMGCSDALCNLGRYYLTVRNEPRHAYDLFYKAAIYSGNKHAYYCLGLMYQRGDFVEKDLSKAMRYFQESAKRGSTLGQYYLALAYYKGFDAFSGQNLPAALACFTQSAQQGFAKAQRRLAIFYHKGLGTTEDIDAAILWYRKAADRGCSKSQFALDSLQLSGTGISSLNYN